MQLEHWRIEPGEDISIYASGYPAPYTTSYNPFARENRK